MVRERDYAGERERKKNQSEFQFQGGTQGLVKNAPRRPNNKPRIPVDKEHYVPGRATQEARQLAAAHSRSQQLESEQLPPEYEQEQTQEVAIAVEGTLVLVIGAVVLVAYGSTLFLQVQDENGETQTLNEYAARPVADLLEQVTSDVANYYQTEGKEKLAEIRSGASRALNKILVRKEPEPQVYTSPNGEQGTIEHTGHAPPEVETGTPGTDLNSAPKTPRHTGHGEREQQTAEDFVMEAKASTDFSVTSGGTTLHTGKNFKDHFLRHKKILAEALGTDYKKLKADGPRFLEDIAKIIDNGTVKYEGMGVYKEGFPPAKIYRGNGMTVIVKPSGEWVTLLESGKGMDNKIKF